MGFNSGFKGLIILNVLFNFKQFTLKTGYNDIGLYNSSSIMSAILWYQLIPHC